MTVENTDYDVVIVGYGPTGGILANILGHAGVKTCLIERTGHIYPKPRGIGCYPEAWRCMQMIQAGTDYIEKSSRLTGGTYLGIDGEPILNFDIPPPPYSQAWHPAQAIIQTELEEYLRTGVDRFPESVKVLLSHDVVGLEESEDVVTLAVRKLKEVTGNVEPEAKEGNVEPEAKDETVLETFKIKSKFVVGSDGGASVVRKSIGIKYKSLGFDEPWVALDAWITGEATTSMDPTRGYIFCDAKRPALTFPCPGTLRRWEIKLLEGDNPEDYANPETGFDLCKKILAQHLHDDAVIKPWRIAVYNLHTLVAENLASKGMRVFLTGDAAHQMPPFMGQGLCSGVRDANFLGWRLAYYLRNQQTIHPSKSQLLTSYDKELNIFSTKVVDLARGLGVLIGELDAEKAAKRDFGMRMAMKSGHKSSWEDRMPIVEDGIIASGAPGAGKSFVQPYVFTGDGQRKMMDDALPSPTKQTFLLIGKNVDSVAEWLSSDNAAFLAGVGVQKLACLPRDTKDGFSGKVSDVVVVKEEDSVLADWFIANGETEVALVRPERSFCYGAAKSSEELNALVEGLKKWF
ncbi:hypothetical protein HDU93_002677 [Gonapodya sp. JEL0774]|nr:hypothetical protein HDU93_002677 [Gonapodya sp. JEL0774]